MELWQSGYLLDLFQQSLTIQRILKSVHKAKLIDQISRKFVEEMQKGNVNGALKHFTSIMQSKFSADQI